MSTAITKITDMTDERLGDVIAKSSYFQDARQATQAIVKVLAGREIGIGPIASMTGIHIIQGRVAFGANIMAAALKLTGRYTYRVRELSEKECAIEYYEIVNGKAESIGISRFTAADAAKAGTKNMDKYPKNMLFARAMSNGVKWYTPDVFTAPVYTPEELGAEVNEEGEVIDARPVASERTAEVKPEPKTVDTDDPHAKAVALYEAMRQDAAAVEIMAEPAEAFATHEDLIKAGRELRAALNAKTKQPTKNGVR